jgi:hypothetical protein
MSIFSASIEKFCSKDSGDLNLSLAAEIAVTWMFGVYISYVPVI